MGSYYDYYSSYFPSYRQWTEQYAKGEESQERKKNVRPREGHSPWKIFTAVFLVIFLIGSIIASVIISVIFLNKLSANESGGTGISTPSVPLTGTNIVFITDVKIADSMSWPWNSQLLDSTTSLYQQRAEQVCQSISSIFSVFPTSGGIFLNCQVNAFRFGSIYVNLGLTINCQDTSSLGLVAMSRQIQSIMVQAMQTSWFPAPVYFNSTSLTVNAVPVTASNPCQAMPCQQICLPSDSSSSHVCSCFNGYQLVNGRTCIDINECNSSSIACTPPSGMCVNQPGTYSCMCNKGYYDPNNEKACVVIPYCDTSAVKCDPYTTTCQNVIGNYSCTCLNGYSNLQANNSCLDTNECQSNNGWCDIYTTTCTNTIGSYGCDCQPNFERIPGVWSACQNIDECFTGAAQCDINSTYCVDTFGNYSCECKWGYKPNPNSVLDCTDVNECDDGTLNNCDLLSTTCNNTVGGFDCLCLPGFLKNASRRFCTYQGMCPTRLDMCDRNTTMCMDTGVVYNYTCDCKPGYTPVDQYSCKDIDECAIGTSSCNATLQYCINTLGSFTCQCKYGNTSGICNVREYGVQVYVPTTASVASGSSISFTTQLQAGWSDVTSTTLTVPVGGVYLIIECVGINSSATFPRYFLPSGGSYGVAGSAAASGNFMTSCTAFLDQLSSVAALSLTNVGASTISLLENVNSFTAVNLEAIFPNGNGMSASASGVALTAGSPLSITFNPATVFKPFFTRLPPLNTQSFTNFSDGFYVFMLTASGVSLPAFSLQLMINLSPQAYFYFSNPASDNQTSSRSVMLSLTASDTIAVMANSATSGSIEFVSLLLFPYAPLPMVPKVAWLAVGCTLPSTGSDPNLVCSNIVLPSPNTSMSPATFTAPVAGIYWLEFSLVIQLTAGTPADVSVTPVVANATSWVPVAPALIFSLLSPNTTGLQTLSRSSLVELMARDRLSLKIVSNASPATAIISPQLRDSEFGGFLLYPK